MDGTVICQGVFFSSANNTPRAIVVPSGTDWIHVRNESLAAAVGSAAPALGFDFYWQRGMLADTAIVQYKENGVNITSTDVIVSGGILLYDPSGQTVGAAPLVSAPRATTASTNAVRPVVSTANTDGLAVGSVVRMSNTAQDDVNGIDMVVGAVTAGVSFTLLTATNPLATAPGLVGGAGFYRVINTDSLFYPRRRFVVEITSAANAQVSTSVEHSLTPGQQVRFSIPAQSGMIELNPTPENSYLSATVVEVVDAYNFTIDVDSTAFTNFTWPTDAQTPCDFPQVIPFGEDTGASLVSLFAQTPLYQGEQVYNSNTGLLADSTINTGFLGVLLGIGGDGTALGSAITGPAGSAVDQRIVWRAGKSSLGGA